MKVKRYVVQALPEALPMIRSDLGVDAIILSTKEIRVGGFLGMFGKKKMEVIAAVENNGNAKPTKTVPRTQPVDRKPVDDTAATLARINAIAAASSIKSNAQTRKESIEQAEQYVTTAAASRQAYLGSNVNNVAVAPPPVKEQPINEPKKQRLNDEDLMAEIRDMKQWIVKMSRQQQVKASSEPIQALHDRLKEQEVNSQWIEQLIEQIEKQLDNNKDEAITRQAVWDMARLILLDWMKGFEGEGIRRSAQVVHFVGPTGVGKTTTIAKLAAEQTLKAGRKVGFITSDTYRIAAVDQLRTYATILNVPLEVVFSPSEVYRAFRQLKDKDLVFMDTSGP